MTTEDPRVILPVDPEGRLLLVFHPASNGGTSGWAVLMTDEGVFGEGDLWIRVRFGAADPEEAAGALVVRELYVTGGNALSGRALRAVPLSRLEAAVNTPAARKALAAGVAPHTAVALPWPEDDPLSDEDTRPWWILPPTGPQLEVERKPRLKLHIPKGYGRPDMFYAVVADKYAYLSRTSNRPANELAEANDVPVTTVHGWVKEARKRGFLPAKQSRKGKGS